MTEQKISKSRICQRLYFMKNIIVLFFFPITIYANNSFATDTIVDGKTIQDVVVTGKEIVTTNEKMIIYVNNNIKKYSHDGYSALSMLTIPGLTVDPIDEIVATHGAATMLCINGQAASKDEIKTLNPKDLKRIDYYQSYHPEFPLAQGGVIDFIVKIRDNGGMVFAQANENLNRAAGSDMLDWKMYSKKSEFGIQLSGNYNHYTPSRGTESLTSMAFNSGDITKQVLTSPSAMHANGIKGQLSYIRRFETGTMKVAVSLKDGHNSYRKMMRQLFTNNDITDVEAHDFKHSDNQSPAFRIQYRNVFKNKATLTFGLSGDYTDTQQNREYSATEKYLSETKEKYYYLSPTINFTYPVNKVYTPFFGVSYYYNKSESDYRENSIYSSDRLTNGQLHIVAANNFRIIPNKFSVTLQAEERVMTVDNGIKSYTRGFFTPCVFYSIKLPHGNTFNGNVGMGAYNPNLKYFSTTEKRMDEYQVITGNPNQKIDYGITTQLSFTSNHKWGMVDVFTKYENFKRPLYEDVICDNDRQVYVHTFRNGGTYESLVLNTAVQLILIPKRLQWMACCEYDYSKGHFATTQDCGKFVVGTELTYINRGFQGKITLYGKTKSLSQSGYIEKKPITCRIILGYSINNLSLNLYATNPFMKTPKESVLLVGGYENVTTNYNPRIDYNVLSLRASYRITYGKKHKFDNVETEDTSRSAILE